MFGYIVMNKPEIKMKDFDMYRTFYCGLCRELREKYGISGQITLSYDMTFVILLLSALYEPKTYKGTTRCILHPVKKQPVSIIKQELLGSLISKEQVKKLMDIKDKPEELENTESVSLQPHFLSCHTADGKKGLLLAVILDELLIQTPERVVHVGKPVLAITSEPSALGEEYEILLNSRLLN